MVVAGTSGGPPATLTALFHQSKASLRAIQYDDAEVNSMIPEHAITVNSDGGSVFNPDELK
jgi:hypothetical protein